VFLGGGLASSLMARYLKREHPDLFNRLSPPADDTEHLTAGALGRFSGTRDIDELGDEAWRKRVGFTSRYLSTNHFMGRGFWIWAIPT